MLQELTEWKSLYNPGTASNWHGRSDGASPERFHEVVETTDLTQEITFKPDEKICAFLGFASDEGIRRNQGRPGAIEGPKAIREALSNLPIPYPKRPSFYDVGDIVCENGDLERAQKGLGQVVSYLLSKKAL
ncbi:MAG: arginase family protein, partial [Waddliaceae bacterium]